jgi:RNA polymerase sigma factor for flagellar operon FliA
MSEKGILKYKVQQRVSEDFEVDVESDLEGIFVDVSEEAVEKAIANSAETSVEKMRIDPRATESVPTTVPAAKPEKKALGTREEIITEYAPLIKYIAQKIAARLPANIELDDLISSGVIGLMDAIEKYDPTRDNKFKTYAEFRIRGAILDELRAQDWVPRSVREKAKMLERAYSKIEHAMGRPATDEEICEELKINQEEYYDLLNQVRSVSLLSYDDLSNLSKGDRRMALGLSDNSRSATPFSEVNVAHLKKNVAEAINELPEKQKLVLSLYYYEDLNLKEIGKVLDVTESRVSQLHTQAILRLRGKLKSQFDDFILLFS